MNSSPEQSTAPRSSLLWARSLWESGSMLVLYLILFAAFSMFVPYFFSWINMQALAQLITSVGIVACGMLFCLSSGDFDLSVGAVAAVAGIVAVIVTNATGSTAVGIAAGLASGAAVGFLNGFIVAALGINALITTLATMQMLRGLAYIISQNTSVPSHNSVFNSLFTSYSFLGIPSPIWLMFGVFLFAGLLLHKTTFGRNTLAIGGNRDAARLAGIATTRTRILIFMLQGTLAALAGVVEACQNHYGLGNASEGLELQVIAACVLGGVSLTGGVGTILAVIVGVLIMGTVRNVMSLRNVPTNYQYLVNGGILLAAVLIDRLKQRTRS